jgi:tRNA (guanine-N7-)-methyltransferase
MSANDDAPSRRDNDEHDQGQGSFFGRRKGHKLRSHQAGLIEHLLPRLALDLNRADASHLGALFGSPVTSARLEIGFGGGEHLIAEARAFPDTGFIGCEPYVNGMAKILSLIEEHNISNVRLFAGDAAELLAWAKPTSFSRIDLIHPDPWPKRRHWKRRFVQDATIAQMSRILSVSGEFRFVCDIDDYCGWTLMHMQRSANFTWTAEHADDWRKPWPNYTMTRYGRKAEREGRKAAYLIFRRR